jgi:hypothetical protein
MAYNFDPNTMEPVSTYSTGAPPTAPPLSAEDITVEDILRGMIAQEASTYYSGGDTSTAGAGGTTDAETGLTFNLGGSSGAKKGPLENIQSIAATAKALGLDLYGTGDGTGGTSTALSANTMAQIGQQDRQLAESMRQFDLGEARGVDEFRQTLGWNREQLATQVDEAAKTRASQEARDAATLREQQRASNLSSTMDLLTNKIRTGEMGVAEAQNRITAATAAANTQRNILADHAGKALPAGTKVYPNLGANGPIAAAAQALGLPFKPFETLGTFAIDPNAIAVPISNAAGAAMLPSVNDAVAQAAQALAGMGVPMKAEGGPVRGPYISGENGPEMNVPLDDGRAFVFPTRMLSGGASIPQGEIPGQGMPWSSQGWTGGTADLQATFPGAKSWLDVMTNGYQRPGTPMPTAQPTYPQRQWTGSPIHGGNRADVLARVQQMLAGVGRFRTPPNTPQGEAMRPPQMGASPLANALAGG